MKAVILNGPGSVSVGEFPTPVPKAGEVRVRVAFCGICGYFGCNFHCIVAVCIGNGVCRCCCKDDCPVKLGRVTNLRTVT